MPDPGARPADADLPLASLVEGFEAATVPLDRFHHREHMRVALYYLAREPVADAVNRIRVGLARLLARHGLEGYHETVTLFWMKLLASRLATTDASRPLDERIEAIVDWCTREQPLAQYYSPEALASPAARHGWVPPDRRAIDF